MPQQNGRVERKHRHILNVARSLLFQAGLPTEFWGECVTTTAHPINVTPTSLLGGKSPYEVLFGRPPNYSNLRIFGCLYYAHDRPRDKDKFKSRSRRCMFVGYPYGKKGSRVYDLEKNEIFVTRDVRFCEREFPFLQMVDAGKEDTGRIGFFIDTEKHVHQIRSQGESRFKVSAEGEGENGLTNPLGPMGNEREESDELEHVILANGQSRMNNEPSTEEVEGMVFPNRSAYVNALDSKVEPTSYQDAAPNPRWRQAMAKEIKALESNGTWTIEDLPPGKRPIACKWVYKTKRRVDGSIKRYKA
ncbi:hypothetical protein CRG98_037017 [Punica granatum]|uniref:Integrase catalytic domain-containing protein n=1 Tax=Punica granatum TaxID=22663 RepID=A0A2I0IF21_PUNGR|nr:hypothetical protein CRG98_037017 [Punica granatum]